MLQFFQYILFTFIKNLNMAEPILARPYPTVKFTNPECKDRTFPGR
nr:MAG TPA: hypothetical protein [Caudoviricetes sp.]